MTSPEDRLDTVDEQHPPVAPELILQKVVAKLSVFMRRDARERQSHPLDGYHRVVDLLSDARPALE